MPYGVYKHHENQGFRKGELNISKNPLRRVQLRLETKGRTSPNKGKRMSEEQKEKISKNLKGRKVSNSLEKWRKNGGIPWNKGTASKESRSKHQGVEYIRWRTAVFVRDNWTCQTCGARGYVEAHHIKSWAKYYELRFDVSNGVTLCRECHKLTDNYGNK